MNERGVELTSMWQRFSKSRVRKIHVRLMKNILVIMTDISTVGEEI
jgi:hypothetical protein